MPTQRNRVHVDLKTSDLDGETERLVQLGATALQKFELPQIRYTTLTDPDGNKFDLVQE
ncbi:VOC family protein [Agrobacterium rhizogenes]|uniref:VOC family protein n=1 Tax=Rhizobium rhizogenes TaxID=359 RepID=UPI0022B618A9|nr:VOC family protein [Rhizobium rhizogenes]MCZ7447227.1 VOC family protein [Rhizobium rhizogenes]